MSEISNLDQASLEGSEGGDVVLMTPASTYARGVDTVQLDSASKSQVQTIHCSDFSARHSRLLVSSPAPPQEQAHPSGLQSIPIVRQAARMGLQADGLVKLTLPILDSASTHHRHPPREHGALGRLHLGTCEKDTQVQTTLHLSSGLRPVDMKGVPVVGGDGRQLPLFLGLGEDAASLGGRNHLDTFEKSLQPTPAAVDCSETLSKASDRHAVFEKGNHAKQGSDKDDTKSADDVDDFGSRQVFRRGPDDEESSDAHGSDEGSDAQGSDEGSDAQGSDEGSDAQGSDARGSDEESSENSSEEGSDAHGSDEESSENSSGEGSDAQGSDEGYTKYISEEGSGEELQRRASYKGGGHRNPKLHSKPSDRRRFHLKRARKIEPREAEECCEYKCVGSELSEESGELSGRGALSDISPEGSLTTKPTAYMRLHARIALCESFDAEDAYRIASERMQEWDGGRLSSQVEAEASLEKIVHDRAGLIQRAIEDGLLPPQGDLFDFFVKKQARLVSILDSIKSRGPDNGAASPVGAPPASLTTPGAAHLI
jgi:hypothetical protein